jgi:hypothetical protein
MNTQISTLQELFSRPSRWTKETDARDVKGQNVPYDSPQAASWCLTAAIRWLYLESDKAEEISLKLRTWIKENLDSNIDDLTSWNDAASRKFGDIRKAIAGANV